MSGAPVIVADFEQDAELFEKDRIRVGQTGGGVPDVSCFGAGAVDFDDA